MTTPSVFRRPPAYPDGRALVMVSAVGFALIALRFYLSPDQLEQTVVGGLLSNGYDDLWNALFLVGGVAIIVGMVGQLRQLDALGCSLVAVGCIVQAVVIVEVARTNPLYTVALYLLFGVYFLARSAAIYRWVRSW